MITRNSYQNADFSYGDGAVGPDWLRQQFLSHSDRRWDFQIQFFGPVEAFWK